MHYDDWREGEGLWREEEGLLNEWIGREERPKSLFLDT